jgi:acyl carrier protein
MRLFDIAARVLKTDASNIGLHSDAENTARWDSLRHIELILAVESAFGVQFSIPEIVSMQKLGDMHQLLAKKGALNEEELAAA